MQSIEYTVQIDDIVAFNDHHHRVSPTASASSTVYSSSALSPSPQPAFCPCKPARRPCISAPGWRSASPS